MPKVEFEGTLVKIFSTEVVSDRFRKREFVVRVEENYPQELLIQAVQDDCGSLDTFEEGQKVQVGVWLRGRMWQRTPNDPPKWFNSLSMANIKLSAANTMEDDIPFPEGDFFDTGSSSNTNKSGGGDSIDDLPF